MIEAKEIIKNLIYKSNGLNSKQLSKHLLSNESTKDISTTQLKKTILKPLETNKLIKKQHCLKLELFNDTEAFNPRKLSSKSKVITLNDGNKVIGHSNWLYFEPTYKPIEINKIGTDDVNDQLVVSPLSSTKKVLKNTSNDAQKLENKLNRSSPKLTPGKQILDGFKIPTQLKTSVRDSLSRSGQSFKLSKDLKYWDKQAKKVSSAEDNFNKGKESFNQ